MELTQKDYDERVARVAAGSGTDEDARLIKQYEAEGFSGREDSVGKRAGAPEGTATAKATQPGEVKPAKQTGSTGRGTSFGKSQD